MQSIIFYLRKSIKTIRSDGWDGFFTKFKRKIRKYFKKNTDLNSIPYGKYYDFTEEDLNENRIILNKRVGTLDIKTVNWFMPSFSHPMGGVLSILRFAKFLKSKGVENRFIIYNDVHNDEKREFENAFSKNAQDLFDKEKIFYSFKNDISLPECDAAFATRWDSAFSLLRFNKTKAKFYFIQDFEPLFYPAGFKYALVESTYRFGFSGVVSSYGLYEEYKKYNPNAIWFNPTVDRNIYYPRPIQKNKDKDIIKIVFYGRPSSERNGFDLGIKALSLLKKKYSEKIEILSAGEDWDEKKYGVDGLIKNLGLLKSLKEVADLYRSADLGLCFVFTKHTSFQPLELMACGVATVTNYNSTNLWIFKSGENIVLAEPSESCVSSALERLIETPELRSIIIKNGIETMNHFDWDMEFERVWNFMERGTFRD